MGLQSALTTSLTGLQAAEAVIDVVGNNVANSGTVGFKESDVLFANQFLQTQSIGSAPTDNTGGTNPRQIGLGVKVAAINPDFTQGTIQISSNPLDVAIQGDGFLIVEGSQGEELYTRNGQLQTNSVRTTSSPPPAIACSASPSTKTSTSTPPAASCRSTSRLGNLPVAQATQEAFFAGVLSPEHHDRRYARHHHVPGAGRHRRRVPRDRLQRHRSLQRQRHQHRRRPEHEFVARRPRRRGHAGRRKLPVPRHLVHQSSPGVLDESAPSAAITVNGVLLNEEIDLSNLPVDLTASPIWDGRRSLSLHRRRRHFQSDWSRS